MALSQQVEESLKEAERNLRDALAFAARNEKPMIVKQISDMITCIDGMATMDSVMDIVHDGLQEKLNKLRDSIESQNDNDEDDSSEPRPRFPFNFD